MKKTTLFLITLFFSCSSHASAAPVITITSPDHQSIITAGSNVSLTASASEDEGAITLVTYYNGSTVLGQSSKSPYSYIWNEVPAGTYAVTAVATDANSVSTTSSIMTITVKPAPPVVNITNPANGTIFSTGSNINLAASASEFNGTVSNISLYNGTTLLGQSNNSSYNYIWPNVPAGDYTLTAVATDTHKVSSTSIPITVTVTSKPLIAIISPAEGSTFTAGCNIPIVASASDTNGTLREVYFYDGTYYLASTTDTPYTYTWTNVSKGSHSLTAEATDSNGIDLVSAPVNIIVKPGINLPATSLPKAHKKKAPKAVQSSAGNGT